MGTAENSYCIVTSVCFPYRVRDIRITFTPEGAELKLIADADRLAEHTFHVELLDKNGKENPAFNEVLQAPGGKVLYKFRKPLNARCKIIVEKGCFKRKTMLWKPEIQNCFASY